MALLRASKFELVAKAVPNKVSDLLDCEPITALISHAGKQTVQAYLEAEIIKLAGNFNGNSALNLKDYQVPMIAEMLIENYKWESIEDFTLCFRKASCGFYGEIYRIDGAVIGQWFSKYLEEKYDALEQRKEKEKKDTPAVDLKKITDEQAAKYGKGSKYYEDAQKIFEAMTSDRKRPDDNSEENAYQRHKVESAYTPPGVDYAKQKLLHLEWVRTNHDPVTGKPLPTWIPENEWLESRK